MSATIVTDRSRNIIWYARKGDDQSVTVNFIDENSNPYDISGEEFQFLMRRFGGGVIFTLTEGDGLTNTGTSLEIDFTNDQLDIEPSVYLNFLKSTNSSTGKVTTWLNINFTLNGETWDGESTSEADVTVNNGPITITLQITLGGGGGGGSFTIIDYTDFESSGLPASPTTNGIYRLVFVDPDYQQTIDGVQYYNNKIIYWTGDHWISWSADYGAST